MNNVTIYSTPWCAFCKAAKNYFNDKHVTFEDVNIEQDKAAAERIVKETGQTGVPVIRIGKNYIVGFQKEEIENALHKEGILS